jgi:hypothetical protein
MSSRAVTLGLALLGLAGCAYNFKLKDHPPGFFEVTNKYDGVGSSGLRMLEAGGVELHIYDFNKYGIDLASTVRTLSNLGWVLTAQSTVESRNGVSGTRFDFQHEVSSRPGEFKGLTLIVFVTGEWEAVSVELHGELSQLVRHDEIIDRLVDGIVIRGCKPDEEACNNPEPEQFPIYGPHDSSNEAVCAYTGELLWQRLSEWPSPEQRREFMDECTTSLATRKAELGPVAAEALTECVTAARSVRHLAECNKSAYKALRERKLACEHIDDMQPDMPGAPLWRKQDEFSACWKRFEQLQTQLGAAAEDEIIACVMAASILDELERCNY